MPLDAYAAAGGTNTAVVVDPAQGDSANSLYKLIKGATRLCKHTAGGRTGNAPRQTRFRIINKGALIVLCTSMLPPHSRGGAPGNLQ